VTGVSVHVFNRWQWASATFDVPTAGTVTLPADALSVQYGDGAPAGLRASMTSGGFHFIERNRRRLPAGGSRQRGSDVLHRNGDDRRGRSRHRDQAK